MMLRNALVRPSALVALILTAACSEPPRETAADNAPAAGAALTAAPSVIIEEPAQDADIEGPRVSVHLSADGVRIVPAGDTTPGTGHHHLYLDEDLGEPGQAVPAIPGRVVHLGTGVSEYTFEDVAPGEHRLIAVVADGVHVPLQPWVVDTVTFTVR